jgi:hypothetical protein
MSNSNGWKTRVTIDQKDFYPSFQALDPGTPPQNLTPPATFKADMATLPHPIESTTLSTVQLDAIAFLAAGNSIIAVSQHTGVHRATIHNWLKLPEFHQLLDQSRRDHLAHFRSKLGQLTELAFDTIRHTLTDPAVSPAVKLKAALAVIDRPLFPKPTDAVLQEADEPVQPPQPAVGRQTLEIGREIGRNAPCPCGSGNKYKRCCGTAAPPLLGRAA